METPCDLFQKIKNGDQASFEQLFKAYYAPLCLFSNRYLDDREACEEIVQGFFLIFWEKRKEIEINSSVRNYLFGSVRNRCLNHLKHKKIEQHYQQMVKNQEFREDDYSACFPEVGLAERIEAAIAELPDRRREIFLLNREKGLKYREIADMLGLSVKTVETQMGHALKTLRDKLGAYRSLIVSMFIFFRLPIREN